MRFSDILNLPYDRNTGMPDFESVSAALPGVPFEVVTQFFGDHGRNPDFQAQYADLELGDVEWRKLSISASELIAASKHAGFERWFESVSKRIAAFPEKGWAAIDTRKSVVEHWSRNGTWIIPPVFLAGELIGRSTKLHLAEGHTRLGTLAGAVNAGLVSLGSLHEIWLGTASDLCDIRAYSYYGRREDFEP